MNSYRTTPTPAGASSWAAPPTTRRPSSPISLWAAARTAATVSLRPPRTASAPVPMMRARWWTPPSSSTTPSASWGTTPWSPTATRLTPSGTGCWRARSLPSPCAPGSLSPTPTTTPPAFLILWKSDKRMF